MSQVRTAVRGQVRSAIRGNVGNPVGFSAPFYDGIHLDFRTGRHYVKAPGASPTIAPFTSLFTFTGDNLSKYRGGNGLLIPSLTNTPRIEYDVNGNVLGLLVEGSRQNLCLQSEVMGTTWTLTTATQSANAIASPDGNVTADKLVEDATAAVQHRINQVVAVSNATAYTFSIFAKASERLNVALRISTATDVGEAHFNLQAGTVGGIVGAASITPYANGWFRCAVTATTDGVSATLRVNLGQTAGSVVIDSYNGDGVSGAFIWGAQLEQASFPSSYIPTTTVAVTRAADTDQRTFGAEFSITTGSIFAEYDVVSLANAAQADIFSATNAGRFGHFASPDAKPFSYDGTNIAQTANSVVANVMQKAATSYDAGGISITLNGGAVATQPFDGAWGAGPVLGIGGTSGVSQQLFGHIRRLDYYPTRLANNVLQQMTA